MAVYTAVVWKDEESAMYLAAVSEVPGVMSQGQTPVEARENVREALQLMRDVLRDEGVTISAEAIAQWQAMLPPHTRREMLSA
jgi:predicted RNase H-like HicB family nuclease